MSTSASGSAVIAARSRAAHKSAVTVEIKSIVGFLNENLGPRLVAFIADVNPQTANRWASDPRRQPREDHERRLRAAYQIFQELQTVEAAPTVRAWFMGMNPQLDDDSPAEALADDREREALTAARAFIAGG